jgi:hypothetical protein
MENVGMSAPDPAGQSAPVETVDARLADLRVSITGQTTPPPKTGWAMSNNRSANRLNALEPKVEAMFDVLVEQHGPQILLALAQAQEARAAAAAVAADLAANTLADEAQTAWIELVDAKATATKAELALVKADTAANKAALAAAQSATTAAQTKADSAQAKAEAAQSKADAASTAAAAAQANAATAISNAAAANTEAQAAKAQALATQTALTAFIARFRIKRQATPAMLLGATATVVVPWDVPYADAAYTTQLTIEGTGLQIKYKSHTKNDVTVEISNLLGLNLLAGAGTINAQALHD